MLAALQASPIGQRIEHGWGLAALYTLRGPVPAPEGALIVALDDLGAEWLAFVADDPGPASRRLEACLSAEDRRRLVAVTDTLQLPRAIHACLIDALAARGAQVLVFDVVFRLSREGDRALAEALANGPPAILLEGVDTPTGTRALRRERPAPVFVEAAAATSFFQVVTDTTGLILGYRRHLPVFADLQPMPQVAAALAEREGLAPFPQQAPGVTPFWFYGPALSVPTVPIRAVFDDKTPEHLRLPQDLSDTVVFIGISDPGRQAETDHFRTVASGEETDTVAGVELAATAFLNEIHNHRLMTVPPASATVITAVVGALAAYWVIMLGGWRSAGHVAATALLLAIIAAVIFVQIRLWVPLAVPVVLGLPVLLLVGLANGYARTRATLRRRLVRPVADVVLDTDGSVPLDMREQAATVLFADIVGSVLMSDRLSTVVYSTLLNRFQSDATVAVEAQGGIVVEIEGDGLLAVFPDEPGAEPHACRACRAGAALAEAAARALPDQRTVSVPVTLPESGEPMALRLRMGLETGPVMLGEVEAGGRLGFRVIGGVVNTAKRLEEGARPFLDGAGSVALVSDAVQTAAVNQSDLSFECLGPQQLDGKATPILVWRMILAK
ncbi:MAG: adenylate/guanylate cyclase domain-containing protein [Pseudomonadota bacterium]